MRKTTSEKLQAELEKRQQQDNIIKRLQQIQREEEREENNKRYHRRGKHIESLVEGAGDMTDEQFYKLIETALNKHTGKQIAGKAVDFTAPKPAEAEQVEELT